MCRWALWGQKPSPEVLCPAEVAVPWRSMGSLVSSQTLCFFGTHQPHMRGAAGALLGGGRLPFGREGGHAAACRQPCFPSRKAPAVGCGVVTARTAHPPLGCPCWPSSVRSPGCEPRWHSSDGWSTTHAEGSPGPLPPARIQAQPRHQTLLLVRVKNLPLLFHFSSVTQWQAACFQVSKQQQAGRREAPCKLIKRLLLWDKGGRMERGGRKR